MRDTHRLMGFISRGFKGRRRDTASSSRLPPGQYLVNDFPVLSAGPTPRANLDQWTFSIEGEIDEPKRWTWKELLALPSDTVTKDIHCVTKWSKFDTTWKGVSVATLLEGVETGAEYVTVFCDGGYTTNLPLEDIMDGKAWVAYEFDGQPLHPSTAAPRGCSSLTSISGRARSGCAASGSRTNSIRDSGSRTATTCMATLGASSGTGETSSRHEIRGLGVISRAPLIKWQFAELVELVRETPRVSSLYFNVPGWPGHLAGQHVDVRLTAEDGYQTERSYSIASPPEDRWLR